MVSKFIKYIHPINFSFLVIVCWLLAGCNGCGEKTPVVPDKKAIEKSEEQAYNIKMRHLDRDVFAVKSADAQASYWRLSQNYGYFWDVYIGSILGLGDPRNPAIHQAFQGFLENKEIKEMQQHSSAMYKDFTPYHQQLNKAFGLYHYYYPAEYVPEVVTFLGLFDYAHPFTDSILGIGLDCYLGKDFKPYRASNIAFPAFKIERMTPSYIVPNTVKAFIYSKNEQTAPNPTFLEAMVYEGKILFMMDRLLPDLPDTMKIVYSKAQLDWCIKNEPMIWSHYLEKKLLFANNIGAYERYLKEAPFTAAPDVPAESSPRIGVWTGWQIVRKYMKEHPEVTLPQLMQERNAQKILEQSKYKPL